MIEVDLFSLIGKLNFPCKDALQEATGLALARTHYYVEIEHWFLKLLDIRDSDLNACLTHYGIDPAALAGDLNKVLEKLKKGANRKPGLSPQVVQLGKGAWLLASLSGRAHAIRSGHLLAAWLSDDSLAMVARDASRLLGAIPAEQLRKTLDQITGDTGETASAGGRSLPRPPVPNLRPQVRQSVAAHSTNSPLISPHERRPASSIPSSAVTANPSGHRHSDPAPPEQSHFDR